MRHTHIHLTIFSRIIIFICGILLIAVLFVPLWQIELNAPQYPEGLVLKLYPNKIGGNVEIINGLNHYIGMKTLHTEDFFEFTILPYIIVFFALLCFLVGLLKKRKWLFILFILYTTFGVIAMFDFWRWEYNYGHNLSPDAAIVVPGMSYQPPLIGYKQLLNFAAYSIPDIGGFLFIGVGLLLLIVLFFAYFEKKKNKSIRPIAASTIAILFFFTSCSSQPKPFKIGEDACSYCKMTISDNRFGGQIITQKGKAYKFDDTHCLLAFEKENSILLKDVKEIYLINFLEPHNFIPAQKAFILYSKELQTPMGGHAAAYTSSEALQKDLQQLNGKMIAWNDLVMIP
ncbi:MAG: nitrous oxide reductase accessory protein NosL [Bacteroidetes bacterium]|nr:nitrous oxide reductase accessory protein NosL [Bacteroidota bacterium]